MKYAIIIIFFPLLILIHGTTMGQGFWSTGTSLGFVPRTDFTSDTLFGKIYVIGGAPGNSIPYIQTFDPTSQIWDTVIQSKQTSNISGLSSSVIGNKIYIIGGYPHELSGIIEVFDPLKNIWDTLTTTGSFTPRWHLTCSVVNDKIYAIGGDIDDYMAPATNILQVYDPLINKWSSPLTTGSFTARYGLTSSVVDGKIYVIGGNSGYPNYTILNTLEVFDPIKNEWSTPMAAGTFTARQFLTSSVVDGKIYVLGGDTGGNINPVNTLQVFDPSTNAWSTPNTSGTFTARFGLSSYVVNGKIYAIGGYTPHQELNTVEVFTPGNSYVKNIKSTQTSLNTPSNTTTSSADFQFSALQEPGVFELFDALGRSLLRRELPAGQASLYVDMQAFPAGMYFARLNGESLKVLKF